MIGFSIVVLIVSVKPGTPKWGSMPDNLVGTYVNRTTDMRLLVGRYAYNLESGGQSLAPSHKPHLDFESGDIFCCAGKLLFRRGFLFKSPSTSNYTDLFGWGSFESYHREFPNLADRLRLTKELKWRVNTSRAYHSAEVKWVKGRPQIMINGIILERDAALQNFISNFPPRGMASSSQ